MPLDSTTPSESHLGHVSADGLAREYAIEDARVREELGRPYDITVRVTSEHEASLEFIELIGQDISVTLEAGEDATRTWRGVVLKVHKDTEAGSSGDAERPLVLTQLTVRPALALGAFNQATRIFQGKTTLEVIDDVLSGLLGPRERSFDMSSLQRERYRPRDFCVQYKESDLDFAHRLMEADGIGYYFEQQEDGPEVMVLFDEQVALPRLSLPESGILTYGAGSGDDSQQDAIPDFDLRYAHGARATAVRDWDWTSFQPVQHADVVTDMADAPEVYDHGFGDHTTFHEDEAVLGVQTAAASAAMLPIGLSPGTLSRLEGIGGTPLGGFTAGDIGERARIRQQLLARDLAVAMGTSAVLALQPGRTFELVGHPTLAADGEYLITHVTHSSGGDSGYHSIHNAFRCIPKAATWRPARRTRVPRIYGSQTAVVTGPPGADIHTDSFGRVQVRFPWDRRTEDPFGSTSCWIRCGQTWAGHSHPGASFVPRVGMEVLVTFVDGDPDRPVVVGCLHNATHPTPGVLPVQATKSIIRTRTVPHGRGYNELSFEDAQGMERVYVRAERDLDSLAQRDRSGVIGRDDRATVKRDRHLKVGRNEDIHISGSSTTAVGGSRHDEVGKDSKSLVGGTRFEAAEGDHVVVVKGAMHQVIVTEGTQVIDAAAGLIHTQGENSLQMFSPESHEEGEGPSGIELTSPHEVEVSSGAAHLSLNGFEEDTIAIHTAKASVIVNDEHIELRLGNSVIEVREGHIRINNKTFPA